MTARHSAPGPALGVLLIGVLGGSVALADPGRPTIRLEEAYARAEARSPEVRILAVRVEEAEVQVKKAWAILKPQWTASYTFTHLEPGPPAITFPEPLNFNTPAIRDNCVQGANSQMLDGCLAGLVDELNRVANAPPRQLDFARQNTHQFSTRVVWNPLNGSAIPILKNANANVEREAQQRSARIAELRLVVARTYYAALATQEALHAAERAEARAAEELALTQAREELGDRPPLLAEGIRIAATQARIDTRRAKNAHAQALLALALVTFSDDRPDVVWPEALPERPPGSGEALLTRARRRPDVAAALTTVQIAERAESEVWWRFVPTVGVFGGYRLSNVPGITGQRDQWSVGLAATVTLYDGGLRYADLDLTRKRRESAQLALEAIRLRAAADVERAELDLEAADLAFDRAEQAVRLARQNLELSRARFEVGALRPAELQAANDGVLDAEIAVARARAERALAILGMRHAVGLDPSGVGEDVE